MNIYLIPYSWTRHFMMALWCAGAGLLAWWCVLTWSVVFGPFWGPQWDGPVLLSSIVAAVSGASVLGEGNLRRTGVLSRGWRIILVPICSVLLTVLGFVVWHKAIVPVIFSGQVADATDVTLVSLRYRIGAFAFAGISTGIAALIGRRWKGLSGFINHAGAGLAAGLAGSAVWHILITNLLDLYFATAAMSCVWGFTFGLLAWAIPDDLYTGWLRVTSHQRFGHRIPVDTLDGGQKERFVGHFPRGLDLYLPAQEGVMELHVSVALDDRGRYWLRGLSDQHTELRRFLERVTLTYSPHQPAPFETRLRSGDRIEMGNGEAKSVVEFVMLPKEER